MEHMDKEQRIAHANECRSWVQVLVRGSHVPSTRKPRASDGQQSALSRHVAHPECAFWSRRDRIPDAEYAFPWG